MNTEEIAEEIAEEDTPFDIEKYEREYHLKNEYRSCCGSSIDKELMNYLGTLGICSVVLVFSFIAVSQKNEDKEVYFTFISMIIGLFMNNPKVKNKK